MDNNTSPFASPDAGNLQSGTRTYYPEVDYSAMKTPENFVDDITPEKVAHSRATFKLGFHFWDSDAKQRVAIDKFSIVVLEVVSSVGGYRETQAGQPGIKYSSNQVLNSSIEPFALFEKGIKRPVVVGFYEGKKNGDTDFAKLVTSPAVIENDRVIKERTVVKLPDGVSFNQHFICWWIEGQRVIDLKLSTMVSREIKLAISEAERLAGRKVTPERVKTFALAQGGAFWGFTVTKFKRVSKDGMDYAKKGEVFLVPGFVCGVVKTFGVGANPELHAVCAELQQKIRADYAVEVERRKKFGVANVVPVSAENQPFAGGSHGNDSDFPTEPPSRHANQQTGSGIDFAKRMEQTPEPTPQPVDDLPF